MRMYFRFLSGLESRVFVRFFRVRRVIEEVFFVVEGDRVEILL